MLRHLAIKSSTVNTEIFSTSFTTNASDYGLFNSIISVIVNWTVDQYLVFAVQNSGSTDTNAGSFYLIEKL
jgi:hypothetical protein